MPGNTPPLGDGRRRIIRHREAPPVPLVTPLETLCFIVIKAREFDAKVEVVDPDSGSNAADEAEVAILEDFADDPTRQELVGALEQLDDDQRIEVLALVWLGRGDFEPGDWRQALAQAREVHDRRETDYLAGTPLLADYIEAGLDLLGHSCADIEAQHL